jgi:anti-anti-sigma factor
MPLEIAVDQVGPVHVLAVRGRIDSVGAPAFSSALKEIASAGAVRILIDCSELRYVSSAGLGVFCECANLLKASGGTLGFAALTPHVRTVFELSGLLTLFPIYSSREEALE